MSRKGILIGIAIVAALAVTAAVLYFGRSRSLSGAVIEPPWPAPDLALTDHNGMPFSLGAQRGKVVLLFFGYVNCPDECPLTMAHLKLAVEILGEQAGGVQVAMVSTDPERDTAAALKEFTARFDPSFLGLTGTPDQLQAEWKDYGVTVEDGGEIHSTFIYVVDEAGDIRETFTSESEPGDIASDVALLLSTK